MSKTIEGRPDALEEKGYTVGEWVVHHPQTARVFERNGIDYCCAGKRSLEDACRRKGLDAAAVRAELKAVTQDAAPGTPMDWRTVSPGDLIDHIVSSHHHYLRSEEPRLTWLAAKVADVHGERHPELVALANTVIQVFAELRPHMDEEERDFFPACRRWYAEPGAVPPPELRAGLAALEVEHTAVGALLERIRELTAGFQPPSDACNSYLALFHGLEQLEADIHEHIHKENNILHAGILARFAARGDGGKAEVA